MPLFLPGIGFFASSFGLAIDALLFFKLHLNAVSEAASVYHPRQIRVNMEINVY
jgi:hypothetical protein